eukprot:g11754.t1
MAPSEGDVALRGRLAAAENRAKILQLRCDHLELERSREVGPTEARSRAAVEREDPGNSTRRETDANDEQYHVRDKDSEAKRIKRQLEVAERRVQNSLYINEAHQSLATKASEREKEANARAAELARRLDRALEKLESIERKDTIANLRASCTRDEAGIHLAQRELRAHQMDPDLYLPINTAKRRQLARSEKNLQRLRLRHESQAAALRQAQATEQFHSDLRRAAGLGDTLETAKCLESGISVNVPDQHGLSAFLYACGQGNPKLIQMLIDAGGDVLDGDGTITGLIIAARKGSLEVVQTLLDAGAHVDARDSAGGIALHAATLRRHVDVARVLLEAGSDCNAVDQGNNTPLHMLATPPTANDGGCGSVADEEGAALVALLLEWGASAEIKNSQGLTPKTAALDTKNRATVLAYRAFFGEDSGLVVGVDNGLERRATCGVPDAVAVPESPPPLTRRGKGAEKAVAVAEAGQAREQSAREPQQRHVDTVLGELDDVVASPPT